jgi:oligopeptidase A
MTETSAPIGARGPDDPTPSVYSSGAPPERNPILQRAFRFPFKEIRPFHVAPGVAAILSGGQAEIDTLVRDPGPRTWGNTLGRLDRIIQDVSDALAPVHHLLSVAETPELRAAYNAVLPEITRFWSRLPLNQELWEQVKAVSATPEATTLSGLRARHLQKTLRDFRRAGADLPPGRKARVEEIRVELVRLQQRFSENVLDATAAWELLVTEEGRMEGIPGGPRARFRHAAWEEGLEGWLLTLDHPSYEPIMKYAADRSLREEVHRAYVGRCRGDAFDNVPLLPRILASRHELAGILGHEDFADYRLEEAMAKSGVRAMAFEEDLAERTKPYWERDVIELREHARSLGIAELKPWDVAYVAESLRRDRFDVDDELLRPYFPLAKVLDGLFALTREVFGLSVSEAENPQVWHPDVRFYDLRDEDGTWLGSFYTDWFPRKEKRQGAWMQDLRTGGPREDGSFEPHLGFMAGNSSPPEDGRPSLLTHREVQTVFHEFGHLLHHLTSRVPIPGRGGLNVAWDWVELPSQIMENWTWEEEALALFSGHFETGDPLPGEILGRLLAARRFQGGWQQMRQISFGTLDLALHRELAPELPSPEPSGATDSDSGSAVLAFAEERLLPFSPDPLFARSHALATFTHLFSGGYAAGYYSYLWSEVLEADAFTRFLREGILSRDTGRAYLEAILSRGDSAEPEDLFREFMGRDPDPSALFQRNLGSPPSALNPPSASPRPPRSPLPVQTRTGRG